MFVNLKIICFRIFFTRAPVVSAGEYMGSVVYDPPRALVYRKFVHMGLMHLCRSSVHIIE